MIHQNKKNHLSCRALLVLCLLLAPGFSSLSYAQNQEVALRLLEVKKSSAQAREAKAWREKWLDLLPQPSPHFLRVVVLGKKYNPQEMKRVESLLHSQKTRLEKKWGKKLILANTSYARKRLKKSALGSSTNRAAKIFYRPGLLTEALALARLLPGNQVILPMRYLPTPFIRIDIEIHVAH